MSTIPSSFFGMHTTPVVDEANYPQVPFVGLRLVDDQVTWKDIQPNNGASFNFATMDQWMNEIQTHGNDVLYTFYRVPVWAGGGASFINPPTDVDTGNAAFKNFVTTLVTRYKGRIAYYEIWNEPEFQWTGTPAQLVTMGTDVFNIVHSIDPAAKVIGPAPSTSNQFGVHYLPGYYAAGGAPFQDIVGCHGYVYNGPVFATVPDDIVTSINSLKSLMAAQTPSIASLPIFYTEGSYGGSPNNSGMTDDQKVAWLARYFILQAVNGVQRSYWYSWNNTQWGTMRTPATGINAVGVAYQALHNWLSGSQITSPVVVDSNGNNTVSIILPNRVSTGQIVWNPTKASSVNTAFNQFSSLDGSTTSVVGGSVMTSIKPILLSQNQTTYVISTPVQNADGSVTVSGTVAGVPVSVILSTNGVQALASLPNTAAIQQAIIQIFIAKLNPIQPVIPVLPTALQSVAGTIAE